MGMFSGKNMQSRHGGAGGKFLPEGKFRVRIDSCSQKEKGYKGDSAIVEFTVIKTFHVKKAEDQPAPEEGGWSWVNNFTKHGDVAIANVSDFTRIICQTVAAKQGQVILDATTIPFQDEDCELIFSPQNPYKGIELDVEVYVRPTKDGGVFSKHTWSCPPELLGQPAPAALPPRPGQQAQAQA